MLSGPLETDKERELMALLEMHEEAIMHMQGDIENLRDSATTLKLQRHELREEVKKLKEIIEREGKKND